MVPIIYYPTHTLLSTLTSIHSALSPDKPCCLLSSKLMSSWTSVQDRSALCTNDTRKFTFTASLSPPTPCTRISQLEIYFTMNSLQIKGIVLFTTFVITLPYFTTVRDNLTLYIKQHMEPVSQCLHGWYSQQKLTTE